MSALALPRPTEESTPIAEIVRAHALWALLATVFGAAGYRFLMTTAPGLEETLRRASGSRIASSQHEFLYILTTNLVFFLLVSALPYISSLLLVGQFVTLGFAGAAVSALPLGSQFNLLYRHASIEVVCLFISLAIGHHVLGTLRTFADAEDEARPTLIPQLRACLPWYLIVVVATVVAALLEGSAVVGV